MHNASMEETILISTIGTHKEISLKGTFCIKSIGENSHCQLNIQISIMFSAIFFLKPGFHSGTPLSLAKFLSVKIRKTNRAPNFFI